MYPVLTSAQSRALEDRAVAEQGATLVGLMRAAGAAVAAELARRAPEGELVILAGPGNNGGDGWVAARELLAAGRSVRVLSLREPATLTGPAAEAAAEAVATGVDFSVPAFAPAASDLAAAAAIADALLGTGASGPLREPLDAWVAAANASGAYRLAVDVPTGVDADSGAVADEAFRADATVTLTSPKRGLVLFPGAAFASELVVADIGIAIGPGTVAGVPEIWAPDEYAGLVPLPAPDTHKNARGKVLVVAGSHAFPGAAVLATRGAMRAGAGYVTLATPEAVVSVAHCHLQAAPVVGMREARTGTFAADALDALLDLADEYDAVVLGPGMTLHDGAVTVVRGLVSQLRLPLVVDADGLNALADAPELLASRTSPTVLTPHVGEASRLLGVTSAHVNEHRISSSAALATADTTVVLKGAGTVISGAGRQVVNTSGTPALATAGTGDVLAGIIGALLAQGLDPLSAGALGAYVHGRAGEAAAAELTPVSVTAEDLPEFIPAAFGELLTSW